MVFSLVGVCLVVRVVGGQSLVAVIASAGSSGRTGEGSVRIVAQKLNKEKAKSKDL